MIFVDSSYWIAQQLPRDRSHELAKALEATHAGAELVTTNAVVGETWTFLRRKTGHVRAMAWIDRVLASRVGIERVEAGIEGEAWGWLRAHDERAYSFVDSTSFAVMRKLRIQDALAFDGDFAAAGFTELSV